MTTNGALLPGLLPLPVEIGPLQDAKENATAKNPQTASFLRAVEAQTSRIALQRTSKKPPAR